MSALSDYVYWLRHNAEQMDLAFDCDQDVTDWLMCPESGPLPYHRRKTGRRIWTRQDKRHVTQQAEYEAAEAKWRANGEPADHLPEYPPGRRPCRSRSQTLARWSWAALLDRHQLALGEAESRGMYSHLATLLADSRDAHYLLIEQYIHHRFANYDDVRFRQNAAVEELAKLVPLSRPAPLPPPITVGSMMTPAALAEKHDVPAEALRKRLERWRLDHDSGYMELKDRKPRDPHYVYQEDVVMSVIQSLKDARFLSGQRPPRKTSPINRRPAR